jgi:hypothetical protein
VVTHQGRTAHHLHHIHSCGGDAHFQSNAWNFPPSAQPRCTFDLWKTCLLLTGQFQKRNPGWKEPAIGALNFGLPQLRGTIFWILIASPTKPRLPMSTTCGNLPFSMYSRNFGLPFILLFRDDKYRNSVVLTLSSGLFQGLKIFNY